MPIGSRDNQVDRCFFDQSEQGVGRGPFDRPDAFRDCRDPMSRKITCNVLETTLRLRFVPASHTSTMMTSLRNMQKRQRILNRPTRLAGILPRDRDALCRE